jgi:hypothetical protein
MLMLMGIFLGTKSVLVLDGTALLHSQQHFSQLHVRVLDNNGNKLQPPLSIVPPVTKVAMLSEVPPNSLSI